MENTQKALALIVDDEPDILELLSVTLNRMGIDCVEASTFHAAIAAINNQAFDLCLTDMRLPDGNGLDIIHEISKKCPQTPVAMITAHGNMNSAIDALKAGAFDFVNKPFELNTLRELINSALKLRESSAESVQDKPKPVDTTMRFLGESEQILKLRKTIIKLARSQAPIYISGESGTGKELVARLIHQQGPRADKPFIAVNCGAIPTELMESEFFGHIKGSFTGANSDKEGLFHAANSGTLFLDEVAELPLDMQVKLLRVIQEKAVRPVGAPKESHIDVRILSATHRNLAERVKSGFFREDLFYRINVIELKIPSLRQRPDDIAILITHLVEKICNNMGLPQPLITKEAISKLEAYRFPGNVRELENILERAVTLCENDTITPDDIKLSGIRKITDIEEDSYQSKSIREGSLDDYIAEIEKREIIEALESCKYNKTAAAEQLGITFRSLRYRIKRLGIED